MPKRVHFSSKCDTFSVVFCDFELLVTFVAKVSRKRGCKSAISCFFEVLEVCMPKRKVMEIAIRS